MAYSLADKYFVKALAVYEYDYEEALENLEYALSADEEHSWANRLMGELQHTVFGNFNLAEDYLQRAMSAKPNDADNCLALIKYYVQINELDKTLRLIQYAITLPGICKATCYNYKSAVFEKRREYGKAIHALREGILESYNSSYLEFLEEEIQRIESKMKLLTGYKIE